MSKVLATPSGMRVTTLSNTLVRRLIGAAALDAVIYEEVERDPLATPQALAVVIASSVATGIGLGGAAPVSMARIGFVSVLALVGWMAWALLTFEIGTRLLPTAATRSSVGELLRTLGFAATPGLLQVLGVLPGVTLPVFVGTSIWMLLAMIVAVRQSLDFQSTARAVAVCVFAWVFVLTIAIGIGVFFGPSLS